MILDERAGIPQNMRIAEEVRLGASGFSSEHDGCSIVTVIENFNRVSMRS